MVDDMANYGLPVFSIKCAFSHTIQEWKNNLIADASIYFLDARTPFIDDFMVSLCLLFEKKICDADLLHHMIELLCNSLLVRDKNRLLNCLNAACIIIGEQNNFLSKKLEDSVLFVLGRLATETDIHCEFFELHEGLCIRKWSAQLAYRLYQNYQKLNIQVPEVIDEWRNLCQRTEEFVEIRNAWA
jgi:hypothetical protein